MKKHIIIGMIALLGITFTFSSCNKYEEGPKVSLLTKKMRLTGDWKLEKYESNGSDITTSMKQLLGDNFVWAIEKNNTYTKSGNGTESGTWELGEDKDDVRFKESSSGTESSYRILKLKNKELKLRFTNPNATVDEITLTQ